jgi:uncharacterized membrane protein
MPHEPTGPYQDPGSGGIHVPEETAQTGLSETAASGLAYLTFIPAIIFLVVAPYNQNANVRFHAWQSIFLSITCAVVWIVLTLIGVVPILNFFDWVLMPFVAFGFLILWVIVLVNAFQGKRFKIPVLGDFALRQANGSGF